MARSRRRSRGSRARESVKKDWTYGDLSYADGTFSLAPGTLGAPIPLTLSQTQRRLISIAPAAALPVLADYQSYASVPEAGNQVVYAVEGTLMFQPTTWNVGQEFVLGLRLLHEDVNPVSGAFLAPAGYSMMTDGAGGTIAMHANKGFLWETYDHVANIAGTAVTSRGAWVYKIRQRWPKGIRLGDSRALWLWCELAAGSITMRFRSRLRVLMKSPA